MDAKAAGGPWAGQADRGKAFVVGLWPADVRDIAGSEGLLPSQRPERGGHFVSAGGKRLPGGRAELTEHH